MSVEGPHSVPSSKTISGTRMTSQVLKRIQREIEAVHRDCVSKVNVKALVTLLIEHFNSKIDPFMTCQQFNSFATNFLLPQKKLKRISNCGFSYFNSRHSYYDIPDGMVVFKDSAHYCFCAHFLRMPRQSRATRKKCATRRTRGLVLSRLSLGGSSYFLWKRCVVFQQMKNNFYLPCQFFENRRSMRMLLFLPYGRSEQTFIVNSKTSKVIALRCYAWSLGIEQSFNR